MVAAANLVPSTWSSSTAAISQPSRLGSRYQPGPIKCPDWIKVKNPAAPAAKREAEEEWR
jgi:hypothetical protein